MRLAPIGRLFAPFAGEPYAGLPERAGRRTDFPLVPGHTLVGVRRRRTDFPVDSDHLHFRARKRRTDFPAATHL